MAPRQLLLGGSVHGSAVVADGDTAAEAGPADHLAGGTVPPIGTPWPVNARQCSSCGWRGFDDPVEAPTERFRRACTPQTGQVPLNGRGPLPVTLQGRGLGLVTRALREAVQRQQVLPSWACQGRFRADGSPTSAWSSPSTRCGDQVTPEQETQVHDALLAYWTSRDEAALRQAARGGSDVGGRAGATSGTHLDRVAQLLGRVCLAAGAPTEAVYYNAPEGDPYKRKGVAVGYTLPGYYRPTKQWDVVVYHDEVPVVVVELKSQNGPSYSNNANNRAEEAIGNAVDLARARAAGLLPGDPWTGYAFVIEDDEQSRLKRGNNDRGLFDKDAIFRDWSYVERIRLLSQRLVEEKHYDAAWAVATSRPRCPGKKCPQIKAEKSVHEHQFSWRELDSDLLGYGGFIDAMAARIRQHYPDGPRDISRVSL
jgi:hypothetical protein